MSKVAKKKVAVSKTASAKKTAAKATAPATAKKTSAKATAPAKKSASVKATTPPKATAPAEKTPATKTPSAKPPAPQAGALAGARVVIEQRLRAKHPNHLTARIEALGGTVEASLGEDTTLLLVEQGGRSGEETRARKLVAKGAAIEILGVASFVERHAPSADEVLALLRGGKPELAKLGAMMEHPWNVPGFPMPSLGKPDLRGLSLRDVRIHQLTLKDADLREADLRGCSFGELVGCDLRGAKLDNASVQLLERCDLRGASLRNAYPSTIRDCDLREASVEGVSLSYRDLGKCNFEDTDLSGADLSHGTLTGAKLARAKLTKAQLADADLSGADLTGADLGEAMLTKTKLVGATLDGAKLVKANLGGADLTGASFEGADFSEANLAGATVPARGRAKAKGLEEALASVSGEIGPRLRELQTIAKAAERIQTEAAFDMPDGTTVLVSIDAKNGNYSRVYVNTKQGHSSRGSHAESLTAAIQDAANTWGKGTLKVDEITVKSSKSPVGGKELRRVVVAAWSEVCGLEPPAAPEVKAGKPSKAQAQRAFVDALLDDLRSGPEGVARWNARSHEAWGKLGKDASFARSELTDAKLDGMKLHGLDFSLSTFNGASLRGIDVADSTLDQASLMGADLTGATLVKTSMKGADLRQAKLDGATLRDCDLSGDSKLSKASLVGAKLPGVKIVSDAMDGVVLQDVDLCGTDLAGCRLYVGSNHTGTFDGYTRFPPNWKPPAGLQGPRDAKGMHKPAADASFDLGDFLSRLKVTVGTSSYEKGKKLLARSRFKLFHQVDDDRMVAIVKSESDASLLYACILGASGYSCCTHNLNRCGGLGVGPCKHMMVMILGLAQAGAVDPQKVDAWVQASKKSAARFDKDVAAEVFLRYKGAEAGEIDWRPTETVPEDFYAF